MKRLDKHFSEHGPSHKHEHGTQTRWLLLQTVTLSYRSFFAFSAFPSLLLNNHSRQEGQETKVRGGTWEFISSVYGIAKHSAPALAPALDWIFALFFFLLFLFLFLIFFFCFCLWSKRKINNKHISLCIHPWSIHWLHFDWQNDQWRIGMVVFVRIELG